MQTFLPYPGFADSARVLDTRRLGKQRVECFQILRALTWPDYAWKNHPAVRMWRGFVPALVDYTLAMCAEWTRRGYADTVAEQVMAWSGGRPPDPVVLAARGQLPPWLGSPALHRSHRSALLRKDPEWYRPRFEPDLVDDLPYYWPTGAFPRWPVRRTPQAGSDLGAALSAAGFPAPRPGQGEAVAALQAGRDVLLAMPAGGGSSSAALLAGLVLAGPTLWVTGGHARDDTGLQPDPDDLPEPPVRPGSDAAAAGAGQPVPGQPPAEQPAAAASPPAATGSVARAPGPVERAAMAEEHDREPEFWFHPPQRLDDREVVAELAGVRPGLLVVDVPGGPPGVLAHAGALRRARARLSGVPTLLLTGPAGPRERGDLSAALGLADPVMAGGGFDSPTVHLEVRVASSERARRARAAAAVRRFPGALALVGEPGGAAAVAGTLQRAGVRAVASVPGMRASRRVAAEGAWRSGRAEVLVAARSAVPELGRAKVPLLLTLGAPGGAAAYLEQLRLAGRRGPAVAALLLLAGEPVPDDLQAVTAGMVCRRQALLDAVGEPVEVPCGRCDVCAGSRL